MTVILSLTTPVRVKHFCQHFSGSAKTAPFRSVGKVLTSRPRPCSFNLAGVRGVPPAISSHSFCFAGSEKGPRVYLLTNLRRPIPQHPIRERRNKQPKGSCKFANFGQSTVQFPKVARRTSTSIVLLTVLLAGTITPTGVCAFMCERHVRLESQHHCGQPSDTMPEMTHDHFAMTQPDKDVASPMGMSQSCQPNCDKTERLNPSRKLVLQVTVSETGVAVSETTVESLPPLLAAAWSLDSGPPSPPTTYAASYSVRI